MTIRIRRIKCYIYISSRSLPLFSVLSLSLSLSLCQVHPALHLGKYACQMSGMFSRATQQKHNGRGTRAARKAWATSKLWPPHSTVKQEVWPLCLARPRPVPIPNPTLCPVQSHSSMSSAISSSTRAHD